jgi:hypothetical protein
MEFGGEDRYSFAIDERLFVSIPRVLPRRLDT